MMAPEQAPATWVRYATDATFAVTQWLQAENEVGQRLRAYLDAAGPALNQPIAPLVIKLWIDADGTVSRIDYPPFAHSEPNADLRGLVVGQRLPTKPPKGMLLPLRIAVQLDVPSAATDHSGQIREGDVISTACPRAYSGRRNKRWFRRGVSYRSMECRNIKVRAKVRNHQFAP